MSEHEAESAYPRERAMPAAKPGVIDEMRESVGYLHDRLDLLTHRLETVLGPDFPQEVAPESRPDFAPIQQINNNIARAGGRIDSILARLVL